MERVALINQILRRLQNFIAPQKNSLADDFLKYGNRSTMSPDWTQVVMDDKDLYTGYSYAAIRNRANTVARIANGFVTTDADQALMEKGFIHPYLEVLDTSKTFTNWAFWYQVSTYLDLHGIYYLLAIRNFDETRVGNVIEFKLLNPYNIRRLLDQDQLEVVGYVEQRGGRQREIPKQQIIEVRELNPFDNDKPFAMTDAAKDSQFTLKTANDYTRHSLRNNINAPGILTTDIILDDEQFQTFQGRIREHKKGEPIFANGPGAMKWESMQVDLQNSGLDGITEINRDMLISVAGTSKTILGIEQSGTTRETARVQQDLHIEGQILPRIQLIIDALNQDYKNTRAEDYEKNKAQIIVDNPLASDHTSELTDTDLRQRQLDLFNRTLSLGYPADMSARYAVGEIDVTDLGEPEERPQTVQSEQPTANTIVVHEKADCDHGDIYKTIKNQFTEDQRNNLEAQQGMLKNAIVNVEEQLAAAAIARIQDVVKNEFEEETDLVKKSEQKDAINELLGILVGFYGIAFFIQGSATMTRRTSEFALGGSFSINAASRKYIKEIARKVSEGHVETVVSDLLVSVREAALAGASQHELVSLIKDKYATKVVQERASVVATTETNRAFTRAQFEADKMFISQNKLEKRAYKKLVTRSDNPCPFCLSLADEPPIPFDNSFRDLGDEMTVSYEEDGKTTTRTMVFNFESLEAGNLHPQCQCVYQLQIL